MILLEPENGFHDFWRQSLSLPVTRIDQKIIQISIQAFRAPEIKNLGADMRKLPVDELEILIFANHGDIDVWSIWMDTTKVMAMALLSNSRCHRGGWDCFVQGDASARITDWLSRFPEVTNGYKIREDRFQRQA